MVLAQVTAESQQSGFPAVHAGRDTDGIGMDFQEPTDKQLSPKEEGIAIGLVAPKAGAGLGQSADFWKRYDRLADIEDQKLSKNLNGNLDVLLIFVSLTACICRLP